ncbi:MAG: SLC13 family permease [Phototrophicales bacterium]
MLVVIAVLIGVLILMNRFPADVVAVMAMLVLYLTGVVTEQEAVAGFSSSVVITLIGLFIMTHALEVTGVIHRIANRLNQLGGGAEVRLITLMMVAAAVLSLVMNNIAAGAVLLPAAVRVGHISDVKVSKLLIPVAFGSLVGGMATYFTTANIVMSTLLQEHGYHGLSMLDFVRVGGWIVLASVVYMLLLGRRLLPARETLTQITVPLAKTYQLDERMWELQVLPGSQLAFQPLRLTGIGEELGVTVLAIWHGKRAIFSPSPDEIINPYDYILVLGREERVRQMLAWGTAFRPEQHHHFGVDLTEVIIPPRSSAIGQSLSQLDFRKQYGVTAVALWRGGRSYRTDVGKIPLEVGDALLMVGTGDNFRRLAQSRDYLVPSIGNLSVPLRPQKAWWAFFIINVVLLLSIFEVFPLPLVMLGGAMAVILSGCLSTEEAYEAVEWRVIFLIAGMLPISTGMIKTGFAEQVGYLILDVVGHMGENGLIMTLFLLTTCVAQVLGGQVTALIIGPIALTAAEQVGADVYAMAIAVAIGCSTAFLTPLAHPVNLLIMGVGGYKSTDFLRVGVGMTLVTAGVLWLILSIS